MTDNLKTVVKEFVDIAKTCPENLQEKCFELLLNNFLLSQVESDNSSQVKQKAKPKNNVDEEKQTNDDGKDSSEEQEDFALKDLHVKTRKFLTDNGLSIDHVNQIYYKEGDKVEPLFDDLKTTKLSESQIRISLLRAFQNAIPTGDFSFNGEEVRAETELRKCYDAPNFTKNFKTSKNLFEGFEKYDKKTPIVKLSNDGKKELATIIKDLQ